MLITGAFLPIVGCSTKKAETYKIGVDPSFFPLELEGQNVNLFAFTNELLALISKKSGTPLTRVTMSWSNLIEGLQRGQYQAMISSVPMNIMNEKKYSFSRPILKTGPMLVVPKKNIPTSLEEIKRGFIAIEKTSLQIRLLSHYPNIKMIFYDNTVLGLEKVAEGQYSGILVPALLASAYTRGFFSDSLAIASRPLTNQGLRFVTLFGENEALLSLLNNALEQIIESGEYQELAEKWDIAPHLYLTNDN